MEFVNNMYKDKMTITDDTYSFSVEKQDEKAYLDLWLRTRLKRAKSTKHPIEGIQEKEIQRLEYMCKEIRNQRLIKENKEETNSTADVAEPQEGADDITPQEQDDDPTKNDFTDDSQ